MRILKLILVPCVIFSLLVHAQEPTQEKTVILPFKEWKENQILEAQNQLVRLSNKIQLIKTGRYRAEDEEATSSPAASTLPGEGSRVSRNGDDKDLLTRKEVELKRTLEGLQYAKAVTLDEYVMVYLSRFKDDSAAMASLTEKLSKAEAAELLSAALKSANSTDFSSDSRLKNSAAVVEVKDKSKAPSM